MQKAKMRLGDILVKSGVLTNEQLEQALILQKKEHKKLGELLIDEKILTEEQILGVLEYQLGIPYIDLNRYIVDRKVPKMVPELLAKKHNLIAINMEKGKLVVAMSDPLDIIAIDDARISTGMELELVISSKNDIKKAINEYYDSTELAEKAVEEFKLQTSVQDIAVEELEDEDVTNAPIVILVNTIINQAVRSRASDIHIEPFEKIVRIRYRIDGELKEVMSPAKSTHSALATRIKIMGKMDISEKRIPQDGRVETIIENRAIDMRISVLPTVYGEKIVIRLLDRNAIIVSKEELGFTKHNLELFDKIIKAPEGIILLTGPTGSGKTTTLYTILKELNQINKNIITVEDPVEYRLNGVNQVQVNTKAGLTFASGLRSILRQDPDIVMVGEIRDAETAQIATRAAITGHLVLSTLHTNDTASTISRLIDMGIESYMVSSSVVGIIAQRLVKRICPKCKEAYEASSEELGFLHRDEKTTLYKGKGCNACSGTGYSGRIAIHEVMVMDREIRNMIDKGNSIDEIKDKAISKGLSTLNESCKELVLSGITTMEQLIKITYSVDI